MNGTARSIARLLWRGEALSILEDIDEAYGFRSKPRSVIYEKLVDSLAIDDLAGRVKQILFQRYDWQAPLQQA